MDMVRLEHESYGIINIYRSTGGSRRLFGSDVKHNNTIKIAINEAYYDRGLNTDWYGSKGKILEIELSPVQFAEAITSMNTSGVPCTIRTKDYRAVDECPHILEKKEVFREEFKDDIKEMRDTINKLSNQISEIIDNKKTFAKVDKEKIRDGLHEISMTLNSNIPYMTKCFDEQLEKSAAHSKSEVEAYINNKINTLGLQALNEQILELE